MRGTGSIRKLGPAHVSASLRDCRVSVRRRCNIIEYLYFMHTSICTEYIIVYVPYLHIVIYIFRVCAKDEEALLDVKKTGFGKSFKQCPLDRRSWQPSFFKPGSSHANGFASAFPPYCAHPLGPCQTSICV